MGEEFTELQQRADEKIAARRGELAENGGLIEQATGILSELQLGLPHEQKKGDQLRPGQARQSSCRPVCIVRLADVGLPARIELSRQNWEGLVCRCGQIVVDGKLIKDDGLFVIERTAEVSRLIEAGVLLDQGFGVPSGWISMQDEKIARD